MTTHVADTRVDTRVDTHNLKIVLADVDGNVYRDDDHSSTVLLQDIKSFCCQPITHPMEWNGKIHNMTLEWRQKELSDVQSELMGDLFSHPIIGMDSLVIDHVAKTLMLCQSRLPNNIRIHFHLSRLMGTRRVIPDSYSL